MGEQVGFTNCVFEKLCSSENTIFIVLSANTAVAKMKLYVEKQKIYEKLSSDCKENEIFENNQKTKNGPVFNL